MTLKLPKGVRVVLSPEGAHHGAVFDIDTDEMVEFVAGVKVDVNARTGENTLEITLAHIPVEIRGEPLYRVDEETLRRLAEDNGYDIRPRAREEGQATSED